MCSLVCQLWSGSVELMYARATLFAQMAIVSMSRQVAKWTSTHMQTNAGWIITFVFVEIETDGRYILTSDAHLAQQIRMEGFVGFCAHAPVD